MTRLIRVELVKLRTIRLSYGLLATGAALTALFCVLEAYQSGPGKAVGPLNTTSGFSSLLAGGTWVLLMAAVLGATLSSSEFRHSTATLTYLASPGRGRVLAAKMAAGTVAGAAFGFVGYLIALGVGLGFATSRGYQVPVGDQGEDDGQAGQQRGGPRKRQRGGRAGHSVRGPERRPAELRPGQGRGRRVGQVRLHAVEQRAEQ